MQEAAGSIAVSMQKNSHHTVMTVFDDAECNYRISDYRLRPYQIEAQRSGFDLERRSSGVSAL